MFTVRGQLSKNLRTSKLTKLTGKFVASESVSFEIIDRVEQDNLRSLKIRVSHDYNESFYCWLQFTPRDTYTPILSLHQTTDDPATGKDEPAGFGGQPGLHYGKELAKRGALVISPDYPGFGERTADTSKIYKTHESVTSFALTNHIACIDVLESLLATQNTFSVGAIGHSLGASNCIFLSNVEPRVSAYVCSAGFDDFESYARQRGGTLAGWALVDKYMPLIETRYHNRADEMPFDFDEIIAGSAPAKSFFNVPLHDDVFNHAGAMQMLEKARQRISAIEQIHEPDCAHAFPDNVRRAAYAFLEKHVLTCPFNLKQLDD